MKKTRGREVLMSTESRDSEVIRKKRETEKQTVNSMIAVYCHGKHGTKRGALCPECRALAEYASLRTDRCPFMETKTFCSACKVHCYSREMQEKIKAVMRYAGPRMLFVHPVLAVRHLKVTIQQKRMEKI